MTIALVRLHQAAPTAAHGRVPIQYLVDLHVPGEYLVSPTRATVS